MAYKVTVRYAKMGVVGDFTTELAALKRGDMVAVRTKRGCEAAVVIKAAIELGESAESSGGEVLRMLTTQDEAELARIRDEAIPAEIAFCKERIKALDLPMSIVTAEHLLGGEKIIFYFLADGRVDFRQLVKDIARQYRTRIELRQIGVRDEARLLAEYGHCGQPLCCRSFMKTLEPVTMRMAKSQKATLDPAKISGVCGRLMCCLRYEDSLYRELKGSLPKKGTIVTSLKATGKVVSMDVLAQTIVIQTPSSNLVRIRKDEITGGQGRQGDSKRAGEASRGKKGSSVRSQAKSSGSSSSHSQRKAQGRRPSGRTSSGRRRRGGGGSGSGGAGAGGGSGRKQQ
ncbi:MAG: signal peptidase [Planctomycetes bacterium]|nr:signal peptidase [Planctomycetota bacterium]